MDVDGPGDRVKREIDRVFEIHECGICPEAALDFFTGDQLTGTFYEEQQHPKRLGLQLYQGPRIAQFACRCVQLKLLNAEPGWRRRCHGRPLYRKVSEASLTSSAPQQRNFQGETTAAMPPNPSARLPYPALTLIGAPVHCYWKAPVPTVHPERLSSGGSDTWQSGERRLQSSACWLSLAGCGRVKSLPWPLAPESTASISGRATASSLSRLGRTGIASPCSSTPAPC